MKQIGIVVLDAINRGVGGADYADALAITRGEYFLKSVQAFGPEAITAGLSAQPELAQIVGPLQQWVRQFCAYDPAAEEEPDDNEGG